MQVDYFNFRANLTLVQELADRAAEGRAFGNLGNTHYLLGNFDKAVQYHEEVIIFSFSNCCCLLVFVVHIGCCALDLFSFLV